MRRVSAVRAGRAAGGRAGADDVAVPAPAVRGQRRGEARRHRVAVRVLISPAAAGRLLNLATFVTSNLLN